MIELGKLFLPTDIDYNEATNKITLKVPEYDTLDYYTNMECQLKLSFYDDSNVSIDYSCENELDLWENLGLDEPIAYGDMSKESFDTLQSRALKVLAEHIVDSQKEMLEHFEGI